MARPDPFIPKFPNDIIRSGDWNEIQVRTREELRGHKHTGGGDGAPIPREGIQPNAIDGTRIDPSAKVQLTALGVSESLKVRGKELTTEITNLINRANELDGRLKTLSNQLTGLEGQLKVLDTQKLDRAGGTVTGDLSVQKTLRVASLGIGSAQANLPAKLSLGTDLDNTKLALYDHPSAPYGLGIQSGQFRLHLGNPNARFLFLSAAAGTTLMSIEGRGNVGIGTDDPKKRLHLQEGDITGTLVDHPSRPGLAITGNYPDLVMFSSANNTNHGPTIRLSAYNDDSRRTFKGWSIGTAGRNARFLDIGFSTNANLHGGVRDWNGNTVLTCMENGNVGIGALEPGAPLHISTPGELAMKLSTGGNRVVQQFERKGKLLWDMGVGTDANNENFWFGDFQSYRLIIHRTSGHVEIPTGDLRIPKGRVISTSKFFRIDHPLAPERKYLEHCSLEGPEAAVYYRGEARLLDGVATVVLPDYFEALVRPEGRTVQLTPKLEGKEPVSLLAASAVEGGRFTVKAIDSHNPSQAFYWEVKAVRADIERVQVEVPKQEKTVRPADDGSP